MEIPNEKFTKDIQAKMLKLGKSGKTNFEEFSIHTFVMTLRAQIAKRAFQF